MLSNAAPVLYIANAINLASVDENSGMPIGTVGTAISDIIDLNSLAGGHDNADDADSGALTGIALTDTAAGGSWFYTLDSGTNWSPVGVVSEASALLLAADINTRLYFQPDVGFDGTIPNAISFRAWDQTSGISGGTADLTINGGGTAFSGGATAELPTNALVNGLGGAAGFGENALSQGDEAQAVVDLDAIFGAGGLDFFGTTYHDITVDNNGIVYFSTSGTNDYTLSTSAGRDQYAFYDNANVGDGEGQNPTTDAGAGDLHPWQVGPLTADLSAAIAVFWADTDSSGTTSASPGGNSTGSNQVYWDLDTTNNILTVTWDDVGGFGQTSVPDAFQLQLIALDDGSFDIIFRYETVTWTIGGGYPAGFDAFAGIAGGNGSAFYQLPSSGNAAAVADLDVTAGNTGAAGVWEFHVEGGIITDRSHIGTASILVDPANGIAYDDAFATDEATAIGPGLSVFDDNGSGTDSDPDDPLAVASVNGSAGDVGTQMTLASGALLTLNTDGTFDYDPNDVLGFLAAPGSGASNTSFVDSFTYMLAGGTEATVAITVTGLDSDDVALGTNGKNTIHAGIGADVVRGLRAADTLLGQDGNDKLMGGAGSDILIGGADADKLYGNAGKDTFVFDSITESANASPDKIFRFKHADKIDLGGIDADSTTVGDDAFTIVAAFSGAAGEMTLTVSGTKTTIALNIDNDLVADATIVVRGVTPNGGDFVF